MAPRPWATELPWGWLLAFLLAAVVGLVVGVLMLLLLLLLVLLMLLLPFVAFGLLLLLLGDGPPLVVGCGLECGVAKGRWGAVYQGKGHRGICNIVPKHIIVERFVQVWGRVAGKG